MEFPVEMYNYEKIKADLQIKCSSSVFARNHKESKREAQNLF